MGKKKVEEIINKMDEELEIIYDYSPLTKEEYSFVYQELQKITSYMPTHLMKPFWEYKNRIDGLKETQPCSCKSSGHSWLRCINTLRTYVQKYNQ